MRSDDDEHRSLIVVSGPVANMTPMLSRLLGRTVVDKTGLTAKYDIAMEWTPDETMQLLPGAQKAGAVRRPGSFDLHGLGGATRSET
jgi:uncharacterized protein (TIGR03435 family)